MDILKLTSTQVTFLTLSLILIAKDGAAVQCFQCDSTNERTCAESLPQHHVLYAGSCDHVQEAQYCVKMTGVFEASGLRCYECDSSRDPYCPEYFHTGFHQAEAAVTLLTSTSCDHVFEARFCVKTTGMFEGELGTKRFCSARDWGNYCQWVRRPGDEREYRACVFTCWGNSCNHAHHARGTSTLLLLLVMPALILTFHRAWPY